ncbi:hypothetical protein MKX03_031750 [Papaver bracteatum]|nr:hypothetical protein MKX03_031750 [Papaver bracteatum]
MFNSAPLFGTQQPSVFGQNNNGFAPKPFGTPTTPFGSQAAGSMFSGTSTGNFGGGTQAFSSSAFGITASAPVSSFGTSTPAFGTSSFAGTSIFGQKPTSTFGVNANTPAFCTPTTTPAFGSKPNTGFGIGLGGGFGATNAASTTAPSGSQLFNSGFGNNPSASQTSSFSFQTTTPSTFGTPGAFGQAVFGQQKRGGSRAVAYALAELEDSALGTGKVKVHSISFMHAYAQKSHEELRWVDYQLGDKGGPQFGTTPTNTFTSTTTTTPNPFSFGQKTTTFPSYTSPFNTSGTAGSTPPNPFATGTSLTSSTNAFNQPSATALPQNFGTTPSTAPSPFNSTPAPTNPFGLTIGVPPAFQQPNNAPAPFNPTPAPTNPFTFQQPNNAPAPFNPTSATPNPFTFQQPNNAPSLLSNTVGAQNSGFVNNSTPSPQSNTVGTQNSGFMNNSTPSPPSWSPFGGQTKPSQQTQPAFTFSSNVSTSIGNTFPQLSTGNQSNPASSQPSGVATNPFGTLPTMPQISIGHTRATSSIQYRISKMPVVEKAAPVRVSSLLMTSTHLSQCRIRSSARRSYPNNNGVRVPFFSDDEETPSTPKADAHFIPRENTRALVVQKSKDANNTPQNENGKLSEKDSGSSLNGSTTHEKHMINENGADIEALMPKLRYPDYYTEPRIQELAAKERAEPGFCGRVKDFIVGRDGFGSIKFAGETDVRNLDLESLVQFNNREVIVYLDDSKKPPVGQGLNKAAVVTLLNIKCFDKRTGQQCMEGVKVEMYKEMLIKKARDQGAEYVSYYPIKGEWKFRVDHF